MTKDNRKTRINLMSGTDKFQTKGSIEGFKVNYFVFSREPLDWMVGPVRKTFWDKIPNLF